MSLDVNSVFREEKVWDSVIPKVCIKNLRFSGVPVVAYIWLDQPWSVKLGESRVARPLGARLANAARTRVNQNSLLSLQNCKMVKTIDRDNIHARQRQCLLFPGQKGCR